MADKFTVQFQGLMEAISNLSGLNRDVSKVLAAAFYQEAEKIMTEAKQEVPVKWGTLRDSGHVPPPQVSGTSVAVEMGFGGPSAPYALKQHEDLTLNHKVGKAKFLEDPVIRSVNSGLDGRMAARVVSEAKRRGL